MKEEEPKRKMAQEVREVLMWLGPAIQDLDKHKLCMRKPEDVSTEENSL